MGRHQDPATPPAETNHDGATGGPGGRNLKLAAGLAGLVLGAVALVVGLVLALSSAYPALSPFFSPDPGLQVLDDVTIRIAGDVTLPAAEVVAELARHAPAGFTGTEVDAGAERTTALAGTECAEQRLAPVVSATRAWGRGSGEGRGLVLTVSAFGPGLGGAALDQVKTSGCGRTYATDTSGADSIGVLTRRATGSLTTLHLRRGDVVVSLAATNTTIPAEAPGDEVGAMDDALAQACLDTGSSRSDAKRNPYADPDVYTGLVRKRSVEPGAPLPASVKTSGLPGLDSVDIPARPDFPYWPEKLPRRPDRPSKPEPPRPVLASVTIAVHERDTEGPGCGWAFTRTVPPLFDAEMAAVDAQRDTSAAQRRIADDAVRYSREAQDYDDARKDYVKAAEAWNDYADKVSKVARKWDAQRAAQRNYYDRLATWRRAVAVRKSFLEAQELAQERYDEQVEICARPEPEPPPAPTPDPTVSPEPKPEPTPTARPGCPASRPAILDTEAPSTGSRPSPPPDPRPEGER